MSCRPMLSASWGFKAGGVHADDEQLGRRGEEAAIGRLTEKMAASTDGSGSGGGGAGSGAEPAAATNNAEPVARPVSVRWNLTRSAPREKGSSMPSMVAGVTLTPMANHAARLMIDVKKLYLQRRLWGERRVRAAAPLPKRSHIAHRRAPAPRSGDALGGAEAERT